MDKGIIDESKDKWQATFTSGSSLTSLRNVWTGDVVSGILSQSFCFTFLLVEFLQTSICSYSNCQSLSFFYSPILSFTILSWYIFPGSNDTLPGCPKNYLHQVAHLSLGIISKCRDIWQCLEILLSFQLKLYHIHWYLIYRGMFVSFFTMHRIAL